MLDARAEIEADPYEQLCRKEKRAAILRAIESLKDDYRNVLFLSYYEEMTTEEISRATNKSKKQVYNLLDRARATLKPILEEEGLEYEND